MSSYLSSEYKIVQPQPLLNTALVVNTLDGLQSKYDQNKALVDNTIAKYEMLRGLSPMDNEYIAGRVKEAESAIENYKKGGANLAYGSTRDSMLSAFESVAKDPLVQNAVQQRVKFDNLNSEVAKLKADPKTSSLYNDMNYTDALERGRVQDYMQGKIKQLGELKYHNYSDVNSKLAKQAAEYSKQMADEKLLGTAKNDFYTKNTYGKQLTQTEIYNHLTNSLDENDKEQMRINARQSLGKMTKEALNEKFLPQVREELEALKGSRAGLEAKIKSEKNSVELDSLKRQLLNLDNGITSKKQQLDSKEIDIYSTYSKNILGGIAGDYDVDSITKIDVDDIGLKVMTFKQKVKNDNREYALKVQTENRLALKDAQEEALKKKNEEYNLIDKKQTKDDEKPSQEILDDEYTKSYSELRSYLIANEKGFADKSKLEQNAYMTSAIPSGNRDRQALVREFRQNLNGKVEVQQETVNKLTQGAKIFYTSIKEGTSLNNLKTEMPFTVALLQSKKKYEDLTEIEKVGVTLEASSNANYHIFEGKEAELVSAGIRTLQSKLRQNGGNESKKILSSVLVQSKKLPVFSINSVGGTPVISTPRLMQAAFMARPFTSDTDVSELGTFDNDATQDIDKMYRGLGILNLANTTADKYKPNLMSQKAMILSTSSKNDNEVELTRLAMSAVQATDNLVIPKENEIQIYKRGTGYTIELDVKNVEGTVFRKPYNVDVLPDKLKNVYQNTKTQWSASLENKTAFIPSFKYNRRNRDEAMETFTVMSEDRKDLITRDLRLKLENDGLDDSEFKSDDTIQDYYSKKKFPNINEKQEDGIKNILSSNYEVKYINRDGALEGVIYKDGKKQRAYQSYQNKIDDGALNLESMVRLYNYKVQEIEKIVR